MISHRTPSSNHSVSGINNHRVFVQHVLYLQMFYREVYSYTAVERFTPFNAILYFGYGSNLAQRKWSTSVLPQHHRV